LGFVATTNPGGATTGKWFKELNKWFARRIVYILEDNDQTGRDHVLEVARALADLAEEIRVIRFPELPEHGDVSDWLEQGRTKEELLARAEKLEGGKKTRLRFISDGDAGTDPVPGLIEETVPAEGFVYVGGQSGAGKTFIIVHLALCLTSGVPFFGRAVEELVGVAILAAEGSIPKFNLRVQAAKKHAGVDKNLPIMWSRLSDNLLDEQVQADVIEELKVLAEQCREKHGIRLGAIIIDTEGAAYGIEDEDDAAQANAVARIAKKIGAELEAVTVHCHHYGKTASTGLRGSSARRANADAVLSVLADRNELTGESGNRSLALAKARDGEEGPIGPFELELVDLGNGVASRAVTSTPQPIAGAKVKTPTKANATALRALFAIGKEGKIPPECDEIPVGVKCCTKEQWKEYAIKCGITSSNEPHAQWMAFKRAYENLVGPNVGVWEDWVWPIA
jgi:AAA domain